VGAPQRHCRVYACAASARHSAPAQSARWMCAVTHVPRQHAIIMDASAQHTPIPLLALHMPRWRLALRAVSAVLPMSPVSMTRAYTHTHTLARSHAHTLTRSHAHTLTRSHAHTLSRALSHSHVRSDSHAQMLSHIHLCTLTRSHMYEACAACAACQLCR